MTTKITGESILLPCILQKTLGICRESTQIIYKEPKKKLEQNVLTNHKLMNMSNITFP